MQTTPMQTRGKGSISERYAGAQIWTGRPKNHTFVKPDVQIPTKHNLPPSSLQKENVLLDTNHNQHTPKPALLKRKTKAAHRTHQSAVTRQVKRTCLCSKTHHQMRGPEAKMHNLLRRHHARLDRLELSHPLSHQPSATSHQPHISNILS